MDWNRNGWPDAKFEGTSAKGEAQGRVDWKRIRWLDSKFEVTGAPRPKKATVRFQKGGMVEKRVSP